MEEQMPESNEETNSLPPRAAITSLMKTIILKDFERELKKAKCHHGGNLCPNHVMKIFKQVFEKHTVVIDDGDLGASPVQPPQDPRS
jgi:hypothetical protein